MIQKIKGKLLVAATMLMLIVPAVTVGTVGAASAKSGGGGGGAGAGDCTGISSGIQEGVNASTADVQNPSTINCSDTNVDNQGIKDLAARIVNTFSIIVGAAAVIMIIYGGFRYVTSGGESGRVGSAKNALLYAIVGLVIVALAQLIIHFILNQASNLGT